MTEDAHTPGVRVLIIDDDLEALSAIRRMAETLGAETEAAKSGRDALALLAAKTPHLVLVDLFMPEMDGFEVMKAMRDSGFSGFIVAMTGGGSSAFRLLRNSIHLGADQFIQKPIRFAELRALLTEALRRAAGG